MIDNAALRAQTRQRALALAQNGQAAEARNLIDGLIASEPSDAQSWFCRGAIEQRTGEREKAVASYRHAIALEPRLPNAHNNLGLLFEQEGRFEEAAHCYAAAVAHDPSFLPALCNSGSVAWKLGRWPDVINWYDRALALNNSMPQAHFARGFALRMLRRPKEAVAALERAIALKPDFAEAQSLLGTLFQKLTRIAEAEQCFRAAVQANQQLQAPWVGLGNILMNRGDVREAHEYYFKAMQLAAPWPNDGYAHSTYLYSLNFLDKDPEEVFRAYRSWAENHVREAQSVTHSNSPDPERCLRVGYVSPDFHEHAMALFVAPVLGGHDRNAFEVIGFSNVQWPDEKQRKLRDLTDQWHDIAQLDAAEVEKLVRSEQIDILVDLTGHMARNRLDVFARKPAPVQVTWLGYPNTTGLRSMDYRLTDAVADPPGVTDAWHTEKLLRLPGSFLCFEPPSKPDAASVAPCERNGYVTFGSFGNITKVSAETFDDWAAVLREITNARLVLKRYHLSDESTRDNLLRKFSDRGVAPERVELLPFNPSRGDHLSNHSRLDILLDSFPYNGTTTTCEALWMGVPVVSHYGRTHVSRVGLSLLTSVGLEELASASHDDFVARTVALAQAPERIRTMHATLRDRFLASPVCDMRGFVRNLEEAYRHMWRAWCGTHSA